MIFLCFSGCDRMTIVQSVLYHLKKYGLPVWYDNYEHILGDNKDTNYITGIDASPYAVVIFSPDFIHSPGAIEELEYIACRYRKRKIHVFPIFYNIKADLMPEPFRWLCALIYNELDETTGTLLTCNQIVSKVMMDQLQNQKYTSIDEFVQNSSGLSPYLIKLLETYQEILPINLNSRLTLLYSIFTYLQTEILVPIYLKKTVQYLFTITRLDLKYNFKETIIFEQAICLALNDYINHIHS